MAVEPSRDRNVTADLDHLSFSAVWGCGLVRREEIGDIELAGTGSAIEFEVAAREKDFQMYLQAPARLQ